MKKILSLMALLMLSITATWADTVDDLVAVGPGYTFIADNITSNGTSKLTANTLYDSNRIFAPTANSVAADKGNSTIGGNSHFNSLRLKNTQDQLVFKLAKKCVVKFYTQSHSSRGINIGSTAGGTDYGQQTASTTTFECAIPAGLVYLSSYGGDFYFAGFEVKAYTSTITYVNTEDWEDVYVWTWKGSTNFNTPWPGTPMTDTETTEDGHKVYSWSTTDDPTNVLFNNGTGTQTADFAFVDGSKYTSTGRVVIKNDYTLKFKTDKEWTKVYAYAWNASEDSGWPGEEMTLNGDTYTSTVQLENDPTGVLFHNGSGDQTPDFSYVEDETYQYFKNTYTVTFTTDADWETVKAYAWTEATIHSDPWPGTTLTPEAGVYTYTLNIYGDAPANIQFNKGDDTGKTPDLTFTNGRAYKWITKVTPLYALAASETKIPAGTTVNVTDAEDDVVATLTYGKGGNDFNAPTAFANDDYAGFTAFTSGNGTDGDNENGTFYTIVPKYDGNITVAVSLNANKKFYIKEDGTSLAGFDGIKIPYKANTAFTFAVKAGSSYKIYCEGSKLGFFGFDYTGYTKTYTVAGTKDLTGTPDDWDIVDANNMVLNGETGLYEWTANDIIVSETVVPLFKVVKDNTDWYPVGGPGTEWKINLAAIGAKVAGKYDIKITFNPSSKEINVTATKTYEALEISDKEWATTVTNSALDFSAAGIEAYTATLSGTTVTLTKVNDVQAETGLVLKGAEDTHYIPVAASSSTDKGSLMFSSTLGYNMWGSHSFYGLTVKDGKAKFAKLTYVEGKTIPARKAFLLVEDGLGASANELNVVFDNESGDVTGINTLNAERNNLNGEMYNLAGQKVNKSYKGIVITNGNKVMMK